jgi:hypothetical protein
MVLFQVLPHAADRTTLRITPCVPASTLDMPGFERSLARAREGLVLVNDQDMRASIGVQRGLSSRFATPGRLSWLEPSIWQIARYIVGRVLPHAVTRSGEPDGRSRWS